MTNHLAAQMIEPYRYAEWKKRASPRRGVDIDRIDLALAPSLLGPHSVTLSRLTMNRFLQIFTRWKWHLLPLHGPFYLVLCHACNIPSQVPPKRHFFPLLLVRDNPSAFIRFRGSGGSPVRAFRDDDRGPVKTREGFTRLGFKFFSRWGHYTLRGYKQRTNSVAMELEK